MMPRRLRAVLSVPVEMLDVNLLKRPIEGCHPSSKPILDAMAVSEHCADSGTGKCRSWRGSSLMQDNSCTICEPPRKLLARLKALLKQVCPCRCHLRTCHLNAAGGSVRRQVMIMPRFEGACKNTAEASSTFLYFNDDPAPYLFNLSRSRLFHLDMSPMNSFPNSRPLFMLSFPSLTGYPFIEHTKRSTRARRWKVLRRSGVRCSSRCWHVDACSPWAHPMSRCGMAKLIWMLLARSSIPTRLTTPSTTLVSPCSVVFSFMNRT